MIQLVARWRIFAHCAGDQTPARCRGKGLEPPQEYHTTEGHRQPMPELNVSSLPERERLLNFSGTVPMPVE
jgi:hypothetical protein